MATGTAVGYAQGFTTLDREVEIDALPVTGTLPPWLTGTLLRNGPGRFEHGERTVNHWFDGLAMLHRFTIADGRVAYANRLLHSKAERRVRETGQTGYAEFATDPCRSIFQRVASLFDPKVTDNANVNLVKLGDRFVAMTETPLPVAFDPDTLEALGVPFRAPGHVTTAHPHRDRATGEQLNYVTRIGPRTTYRVWALAPDGRQRTIATVPVRQPAYMHSFALTERHVVLAEFPFVLKALRLAAGRPFVDSLAWEPQRGVRYTVVERATGRVRARIRGEALFAFHHVNAYDDDDERVVVDLCAYEDATIVRSLFLDRLRGETGEVPMARLRRCTIDLARGTASMRTLSDTGLELPRIDYGAVNERPYRFAYGVGRRPASPPTAFFDQLVKIDVRDGSARTWSQDGCYPGEPIFVPAPAHRGEDDGVCLSVVLDAARGSSFLLVLDAGDLTELARAEVPHHVPFGFHGQFVRGG